MPHATTNSDLKQMADVKVLQRAACCTLARGKANCDTLQDKAAYGVVSMHWPP